MQRPRRVSRQKSQVFNSEMRGHGRRTQTSHNSMEKHVPSQWQLTSSNVFWDNSDFVPSLMLSQPEQFVECPVMKGMDEQGD